MWLCMNEEEKEIKLRNKEIDIALKRDEEETKNDKKVLLLGIIA